MDSSQAIPKRRDLAQGGAAKMERSRARGLVAGNTLTARPEPYHRRPGIAFGSAFFSPRWDSNYRWPMNSSIVKPACSTMPFSVPGFRGLCCGTTSVLGPLRRIRCEPVWRSWTNPQRFNAPTASAPLTSRGTFTTPRGLGLARSATARSGGVGQPRNNPQRHQRS